MEKQNTLIDLLKTFLKDYERIDKIDETLPSIYSYISDKIHFNNNGTFPSSIPSGLTDDIEGNANQIFWVQRIANLLKIFNDNFKILETDEDETRKEKYLSYAENMKIIKNRQRINVEDLNDNFKLISTGFKLITDELFGTAVTKDNKYLVMFNGIAKELIPLWENVLYLWLNFLLKEREKIEKPIVIFAYLNESQLINHQKFDGKKISLSVQDGITIDDVIDRIECYIDEFPNSHLCIIPIIRQLTDQKYYGEECYPGIFYHAPNFNSQLLKCDRKFIYYPFRDMGTKGHSEYEPFNPFNPLISFRFERRFLRAGFLTGISKNSDVYLYLGDITYGYRVYDDHLYYAAPYDEISNIKEIVPKKYYSAVKSFVSGSFFIDNGVLMISDFAINYQDMVGYNVDRTANNNIVAQYKPDIDNANYLCLSLDDALTNTNERYILKEAIFMKSEKTEVNSHTLTKVRNFRDRIAKNNSFKFQYFDSSCISGQTKSVEEDYSYLIEYIPLKYEQPNSGENSWVRESSMGTLKTYVDSNLKTKDNDLLEKHVVWDDERNNILEDKFVLRIGQHIEADAVPAHSDLIPDDFKFEDSIKYFDYKSTLNHDIEEKTSGTIKYYNNGTAEVGAYLNIPFIKNPKKRLQFYPEFLSHSFGSDNLVPLNSIEYFDETQTNKPEYFSYNKVFRDYPIKKDVYFQIYTSDGKEHFENDNWCIKMIEVVSQDTPYKESFFSSNFDFENIKTMEQLYQMWKGLSTSEKNILINEGILLYASQLCPSEVNTDIISNTADSNLMAEVKQNYRNIVNYFYPSASSQEKEEIYTQIYHNLFETAFNEQDKIYHLIHEKNLENNDIIKFHGEPEYISNTSGGGLKTPFYDPKIQLGILGKENPTNNLWEKTFYLKNGQRKYTDDLSHEALDTSYKKDYFGYLKPIERRLLEITIDGVGYGIYYKEALGVYTLYLWNYETKTETLLTDRTLLNTEYVILKKSCFMDIVYKIKSEIFPDLSDADTDPYKESTHPYTVYYAIYINNEWNFENTFIANSEADLYNEWLADYCIPQIQLKKNTKIAPSYSQQFYDEIYKKDQYLNNKIIGSRFLSMGFCCACRVLPIQTKKWNFSYTDPTFYNDTIHEEGYWDNAESKVIRFEIFGSNIPLFMRYWNYDNTFDTYQTPYERGHRRIALSPNIHQNDYLTMILNQFATAINPSNSVWVNGRQFKTHCWSTSQSEAAMATSISSKDTLHGAIYYEFFNNSNTTLKPFFKMFVFPLLKYNYVTNRQYPHIFLMSQKTLFPNQNFMRQIKTNNILFKNMGKNKTYNQIKDYFQKLKNVTSSIPYPIPASKETTTYSAIDGFNISWTSAECLNKIKGNYCTAAQEELSNFFQPTLPSSFQVKYAENDEVKSLTVQGFGANTIGFPCNSKFEVDDFLADQCAYAWGSKNELNITFNDSAVTTPYTDTIYQGVDNLNINSSLIYNQNKNIGNMNLQIVIHYFGPNGNYARKIMTRKLSNTTVTSDNHFVWDGTSNLLLYKDWQNDWTYEYLNQSLYNQFKNSLSSKTVFKQSSQIIDDGFVLDFETYPNNGKTM